MLGNLQQFLSGGYAPHGYCLLWQPELIWTHVVSDTLIALAYFSIPLALIRFVRQRHDVAFGWMIWLFALFILACGTTHVMGVWNLWHGNYGVEAIVKAVTAAASVPTAILLWRLIPQALAIPSPTQLQGVNEQLRASIVERDTALRRLKDEIAQRERAEAALLQAQKMDAIGQLTGGIAHDFNNLLQAVGGNLDLIRSQPASPEKVARWAENANKGVVRGTKLTSQLLAFSRTQRLERQRLELNALIDNMRDLIQSSIGSAVMLEIDLDPVPCDIIGDPTQIELSILNLIINARDAMPQGGTLQIATRQRRLDSPEPDLAAGAYVNLAVTDTGVGMPPEILARALDPFFTTKGVGTGTGLGLSMAFGVAKQSGGTLRIESTVGIGTTVTLILPCQPGSPDTAPATAPAIVAAPVGALRGRAFAVIDDDPDVRRFVVDCLEVQGAECNPFDGGEPFLAALPSLRIDGIFLDFAMPGLSGAEVASRARRLDAAIPIYIMTGYAESAALDQILGDVKVVRKPFTADALIQIARSLAAPVR